MARYCSYVIPFFSDKLMLLCLHRCRGNSLSWHSFRQFSDFGYFSYSFIPLCLQAMGLSYRVLNGSRAQMGNGKSSSRGVSVGRLVARPYHHHQSAEMPTSFLLFGYVKSVALFRAVFFLRASVVAVGRYTALSRAQWRTVFDDVDVLALNLPAMDRSLTSLLGAWCCCRRRLRRRNRRTAVK